MPCSRRAFAVSVQFIRTYASKRVPFGRSAGGPAARTLPFSTLPSGKGRNRKTRQLIFHLSVTGVQSADLCTLLGGRYVPTTLDSIRMCWTLSIRTLRRLQHPAQAL